jgi:branched-chain amino acid transport system substrate-binding protein
MTNRTPNMRMLRRRDFVRGVAGLGAGLALSRLTACAPSQSNAPSDAPSSGESATADAPIKIGLVAAITGPSALSGESITRGLTIAIDEINKNGGVLGGRALELVIRDDESTPAKGVTAARELIEQEQVAIIFGGLDSPVSLAMLPVLHELEVPYMGVWAAATGITRNEFEPNYAFRVSANDHIVDQFLLQYSKEQLGVSDVGLVLINNPWGESNEEGFKEWAPEYDVDIVGIEKFNDADTDLSPQLTRLREGGAEALLLVANAAPGAQAMRSLTRIGWDVPVVSHWGISGGRFPELAGADAAEQVVFVQTYSFYGEQSPVGQQVLEALDQKYGLDSPGEILAPVGVANAYDAMHLTALALDTAGTTEGPQLREAFYNIPPYEGLIKTYETPFTPDNHDALTADDYILVRWENDEIVPVE